MLDVDAARIKLLLKNLLENAVRHTPDNALPPELHLCLDERKALITVIDHGIGVEVDHLPLLVFWLGAMTSFRSPKLFLRPLHRDELPRRKTYAIPGVDRSVVYSFGHRA
jgi:hypothetical protein